MVKRKILGTNKFVVYMYNGKNIRGNSIAEPKHFLGKQWGRVFEVDENGNQSKKGYAFVDYGQLISYINKKVSKTLHKNMK